MSTTTQPLSQSPAPMELEAPSQEDRQKPTFSSELPVKAPSPDVHKDTPQPSTHKDTPPAVPPKELCPTYSQDRPPFVRAPSSGGQKFSSSAASKDAPLLDPRKAALSSQGDKPAHSPDVSEDVRASDSQTAAPEPSTHKDDASTDARKEPDTHKEHTSPDTQKEATTSDARKEAPPSDTQKPDTTKEPAPEKESEGTPKRDPNMPKLRPEQMARPTEVPPQPHTERMQKEREEKKEEAQKGEGAEGNEHEYPEQKHAGRVGYGPNYVNMNGPPGVIDKIKGFKEEIKGKILRKPELVQQGHDRITGELKKKEKEKMDHEGPFAQKEDAEKKQEGEADQKDKEKDDVEQKSKLSGRGGARIETHGESKPAHPDHRDSSYAHTSIAERHKSVGAESTKVE